MKKDFLFATALVMGVANTAAAANNKSGEQIDTLKAKELQEVQVISTRATKKTPMVFTNLNKQAIQGINYGKDLPELLSLPFHHHDIRRWQRHRLHLPSCAWYRPKPYQHHCQWHPYERL